MVAINAPNDLSLDLERLACSLEKLVFPDTPGETGHAATRDRLVRAIRSYLMPRIEGPAAPLLVVFAGSTGAGKSTLLNSLTGIDVSETGALRPTTREPVVLSADPDRYQMVGGVECVTVGGAAPILESLAFADTPDIDSTAARHREVAEIMIDHADIVVFVSSASRYGDLVPWEVIRRARSRGAPLLLVLNRVSSDSGVALADYQRLLEREGLGGEVIRGPRAPPRQRVVRAVGGGAVTAAPPSGGGGPTPQTTVRDHEDGPVVDPWRGQGPDFAGRPGCR